MVDEMGGKALVVLRIGLAFSLATGGTSVVPFGAASSCFFVAFAPSVLLSELRVNGVGSGPWAVVGNGDPGDVKGEDRDERGVRLKSGVGERMLPAVEFGNESALLRGPSADPNQKIVMLDRAVVPPIFFL